MCAWVYACARGCMCSCVCACVGRGTVFLVVRSPVPYNVNVHAIMTVCAYVSFAYSYILQSIGI